jgi:hypothetical protein
LKFRFLLLLLLLTGTTTAVIAQGDKWTGNWRVAVKPWSTSAPIILELQIGQPVQQVLYPAIIKIQYGEFTGIYEVLLAKKNEQQLGIGRNKYPLQETPYKLGIWMWYLNGTLDYHNGSLTVNRMWIDKFGIWMRGLYSEDEIFVHSKATLRGFLYQDSLTLKKAGNKPLADSTVYRILHPESTRIYFGIYDNVITKDSVLTMQVEDQEQYDKDTVTLLHNGRAIFTKAQINAQNRQFDVTLDTGKNLFVFFADNYGSLPPNTGFLRTTINNRPYGFDFSDRPNAYATFLVASIYRTSTLLPEHDTVIPLVTNRTAIPVATIPVNTGDIILELRDTRVEDGDSISLSLNGKWIAQGFPVKTLVQQISIKLQKGENILLFTADNLGRIPPNTAELRIRYGKQSKILNLSTDMRRNNEIRLIWEE